MSVRLLKLDPVGVGTPQIESLPSFLIRLASEHGATAREVVAVTACNVAAQSETQVQVLNRGLGALVRPDDQSGAILQQLQLGLEGCASALPRTTFQCLKGAFDKPGSAIANTFKWCPRCFRQDEALGQPTYLRLLWHFSALESCPIHKIPLYSVCSSCGKRQDRRCRREELHICVWCEGNLTIESKETRPLGSWENEDQDLVDLVSAISGGEFTTAVEGSATAACQRPIVQCGDVCLRLGGPDLSVSCTLRNVSAPVAAGRACAYCRELINPNRARRNRSNAALQ